MQRALVYMYLYRFCDIFVICGIYNICLLCCFPTAGARIHYIDFNAHTTNSIYLLVNVLITATPIRIYHAYHSVIFMITYQIFSAVYQAVGGTNALGEDSIYESLDWNKPGHAILIGYVLNIVGLILLWIMMYGLYCLRLLTFTAYSGRTRLYNNGIEEYDNEEEPLSLSMDTTVVKYTT